MPSAWASSFGYHKKLDDEWRQEAEALRDALRAQNLNVHLIGREHGGDPTSVEFCHNVGLDYVSCSPFRVPIARLAAAQAAIKNPRK